MRPISDLMTRAALDGFSITIKTDNAFNVFVEVFKFNETATRSMTVTRWITTDGERTDEDLALRIEDMMAQLEDALNDD